MEQAAGTVRVLKGCDECPYKVKTSHNKKFLNYVKTMTEQGFIDGKHRCHMKVKDKKFWAKPNAEDVCVNSLKQISKTN